MADPKVRSVALLASDPDTEPSPTPKGRRKVRVRTSAAGQIVEIRDPLGDLEVEIRVTDEGAVVHLNSARLELESTEAVDIHCRTFEVHAQEEMRFVVGGSLRMDIAGDHDIEAEGDYRVKADTIWLN